MMTVGLPFTALLREHDRNHRIVRQVGGIAARLGSASMMVHSDSLSTRISCFAGRTRSTHLPSIAASGQAPDDVARAACFQRSNKTGVLGAISIPFAASAASRRCGASPPAASAISRVALTIASSPCLRVLQMVWIAMGFSIYR